LGHVALGARELGLVLDLEPHDEVDVVPQVVLLLVVLLKSDRLVVEAAALQATDEAGVPLKMNQGNALQKVLNVN
jgi:hypothetical protein